MVGSYPQPHWLVDHTLTGTAKVPRVRQPSMWRIPADVLREAQDDATVIAIRDQELAGLDIITDGEMRRESYSNYFVNALDGINPDKTGTVSFKTPDGALVSFPVPLFSGRVKRPGPIEADDVKFLRANTSRRIKVTLPGPFTMSEQAETDYYSDRKALAMDLAAAVNEEMKDLFAAGADIVQLDEPWMERCSERAQEYGLEVLARALDGISGETALHICFGYGIGVSQKPNAYSFLQQLEDSSIDQISIETAQCHLDLSVLSQLRKKMIILGVIDLRDQRVEQPESVAKRIQEAIQFIEPERLVIAPDCGMKFLPRNVALDKLRAMVDGAALVRAQIG
jgi:5-methyltetrahydropteroyltriglutamate--homocysteine methyltransferase